MPTKRSRVNRGRIPDVPAEILARFRGEDFPAAGNKFVYSHMADTVYAGHWREHGDDITAEWASSMPGTRPPAWWQYSAPRQPLGTYPGWWIDGKLPDPRRRVSGRGSLCSDHLAHSPAFYCGLPLHWLSDSDIRLFKLNRKAERFDPTDPPCFESEAAYLRRHDLLLPGESRHLTQRDYAPAPLPSDLWPRGDE